MALICGAGGDHDHFALGFGQAAVFLHQRVVIGEKGAKFFRAVGQRQEDVRHEAALLLHRQDPGADVVRQLVERRGRKACCDRLCHGMVPACR
jgi:hypothetical protein